MTEKDKPAVAHYASSYLPLTENWIYRLIANHKKYRPVFLSRTKQNLNLFPGITIFSLADYPLPIRYVEIVLFKLLGYFRFMLNKCKTSKVKLLHVHFGYHGAKMVALKGKLNVPLVCSFYGDDAFSFPLQKSWRYKYNRLFKVADKILVLGPYMKSQIAQLGCDVGKISIHHLGIDADLITCKKREPTGKIRFLIASSFVEKKGIEIAIRALAKLKHYAFTLDIIGDGLLKQNLLGEIEQSGIVDRISLHGYQPYEYVINTMYQCDVFIQPSRTGVDNRKEGTPMSIVDAMATGMAVISTRHSDIPEIVVDGVTGYLAEENDVESLKLCIQKIFNHPEKIATLGLNGRKRVEQEFNVKIQMEKLEQLYTELISRSGEQ